MSARFSEANDRVTFPSAVPDPPFTISGWYYPVSTVVDFNSLWRRYNGGSGRGQLGTDSDGTTLKWYAADVSLGHQLTPGQWHRLAVKVVGTTVTTYAGGESGPLTVASGSAGTVATALAMTLGGVSAGNGSQRFDGRMRNVRYHSLGLTEAELEAEWDSEHAVIPCWAEWDLATGIDLADHSGNGRDLTAGATALTTEADPPFGSGPAIVEGTASGVAGGTSGAVSGTCVVESALAGVAGGSSGSVAAMAVVEATVSGAAGGASGLASGTSVVVAAAGGFAGGASGAVTATREVLASLAGTAFGASGHITAEGGVAGDLHPSNTQVAVAWLRQVLGLPAAATLPAVEGWFDTGFVTVPAIAGGNPNPYVPERKPIMQIDTWAANRATSTAGSVSRKIPLSKANQLADRILLATYEHQAGTLITLPPGFKDVWIMEVYPVSEVRRIPEPKSSYAHFSVDIALMWIERDPVI